MLNHIYDFDKLNDFKISPTYKPKVNDLSKYLKEEWHDNESLLSKQDKMNDEEIKNGISKFKNISNRLEETKLKKLTM